MRGLKLLPLLLLLPAGSLPLADARLPTQDQALGQTPFETHAGPTAPGDNSETLSTPFSTDAQGRNIAFLTLDQWFERLREAGSAEEAQKAEGEIFIRLSQSPSPTVNLLMAGAAAALEADDKDRARRALNDAIALAPDFPEALTRSAALAYEAGDLTQAQQLLAKALRQEPRHFAAWAGLALTYEDQGALRDAQKAYREALYWHPYLDAAQRGLRRVDSKLDGLSL